MNSKKLSELTQTPISTIRYYEKIGLVPPPNRKNNNYRDYGENYITRIQLINYLTNLNFKLNEIKSFLHDLELGMIMKADILLKLQAQSNHIQSQLEQLQELQIQIESLTNEESINDDLIETLKEWIRTN